MLMQMIEAIRDTGICPMDVFERLSEKDTSLGKWLRGEHDGWGFCESDDDFLDHFVAALFRLIREHENETAERPM